MSYIEYNSNNSGGHWWLTDENWKALEQAGWIVHWAHMVNVLTPDDRDYVRQENGVPKLIHVEEAPQSKYGHWVDKGKDGVYRYMGALARKAYKPNCNDLRAAAAEWERATGLSATDAGCPCCGQPHNFTLYDEKGKHLDSGPHTSYEARW